MWKLPCALVCVLLTGALVQQTQAVDAQEKVVFSARERARILKLSPLEAPPLDRTNRFDGDARAARLGKRLFLDKGLSANGEVACSTCHQPDSEFTDDKPVAEGLGLGTRRTPSLWNVARGHWFFHDGRADTLWGQALSPMESPVEMGGDRLAILHYVARTPDLRAAVEDLAGPLPDLEDADRFPPHARPDAEFPGAPHALAWQRMTAPDRESVRRSFSNLGKFIAAYERTLVRKRSPLDRFVEGLRSGDAALIEAYPQDARRGLRLFLGKGQCRLCHHGPNFSDGEFHALGIGAAGGGMPTDPGRYDGLLRLSENEFRADSAYSDDPDGERAANSKGLTRGPANWGEFKTPSLRNVAQRPPYMHAGQLATLEDVLRFYSTLEGAAPLHQHQEQILQPRKFSEAEIADLMAFLASLTDAGPEHDK